MHGHSLYTNVGAVYLFIYVYTYRLSMFKIAVLHSFSREVISGYWVVARKVGTLLRYDGALEWYSVPA